jgi:hypothetical protein
LAWLPFHRRCLIGAAFARGRWSTIAVAAVGVGVGFGLVLWAYYSSPTTYSSCECENFLGRWWEPDYVISLVVIGYFFWLFGMAAGVGARTLLRRTRAPIETNRNP